MIRTLHLTSRFQKDLENLEKTSVKAAGITQKVRSLIDDLAASGDTMLTHRSDISRYQEKRIENAIKFDLGSGYRLLAVREGDNLFLVYVGYHDESDRWVKNNRQRRCWEWHDLDSLEIAASGASEVEGDFCRAEETGSELADGDEEDYDACYTPLDDKMLRKVFAGLCQGAHC